MACANCGSELVEPVDVDEATEQGHFSEEWECELCGAKGFVHGREEEPPRKWDRFGQVHEA